VPNVADEPLWQAARPAPATVIASAATTRRDVTRRNFAAVPRLACRTVSPSVPSYRDP
jgi:hypothetical protein